MNIKTPHQKRKQLRIARRLLLTIGVFGIVIGLGTAFYSFFALGPQVNAMAQRTSRNLQSLQAATAPPGLFPRLLGTTQQTLLHASGALTATKQTSKEVKKGVTGIFLPQKEVAETNDELGATASDLKNLAANIQEMHGLVTGLTHQALVEARTSFEQVPLSIGAVFLGLAFGGFYFFMGCCSLALGLALGVNADQVALNAQEEKATAKHGPPRAA